MILVKCPNCRREFEAYIQMSEKSFFELKHVRNIEKCPHCRRRVRYPKDSMRFAK